ncbi:zinc knuckle CX2CX4HX4C containing protein [Tanacetum coccineum]
MWVKILNVPIKAWIVKGISTIPSCLGKPLIIDAITTTLCQSGSGKIGYARVLIDISVKKEFQSEVKICYKDKENKTIGMKKAKVEYLWKPPTCQHYEVFGNNDKECKRKHKGGYQNNSSNVNFMYMPKQKNVEDKEKLEKMNVDNNIKEQQNTGNKMEKKANDKTGKVDKSTNMFATLVETKARDIDNLNELKEKSVVDTIIANKKRPTGE